MIELPEATTIAEQIREELAGLRIESANRGNTPHKFAFYTRSPEEYAEILKGKIMGEATGHGPAILIPLQPGYFLVLGGGGERILYHETEKTLPKKYHLLIRFEKGGLLSVTVQGWGNVMLLKPSEMADHPHVGEGRIPPLSEEFTRKLFKQYFAHLGEADRRSVKFFMISDPGAWGVGNGYLQDILFHAGIHPRHRALDLKGEDRSRLFSAIQETLAEAVLQRGRDTERDLHNHPGSYRALLDRRSVGKPCPSCGTAIQKDQFLGGAVYFCPSCQPPA